VDIKYTNVPGPVVAHDVHVGKTEGDFVEDPAGRITYRHRSMKASLLVNESRQAFDAAVQALNTYNHAVLLRPDEEYQLSVVAELRAQLYALDPTTRDSGSYWGLFLEQATYGHM
jgi:hypothetical protein